MIGTVIFALTGNAAWIGIGIAFGAGLGIAFGATLSQRGRAGSDDDSR